MMKEKLFTGGNVKGKSCWPAEGVDVPSEDADTPPPAPPGLVRVDFQQTRVWVKFCYELLGKSCV